MTNSENKICDTCIVESDVTLGKDVQIWHHSQVRSGAFLGNGVIIGKNVFVDTGVHVGSNCKIQNNSCLYSPAVLEDGVFVGPGVILCNDKWPRALNQDGTRKSATDWKAVGVRIHTGASIGAGSVILPGVNIGKWAMVGAGSVVTKDVPSYTVVMGNPAVIVGNTMDAPRGTPDI